MFKSSESNTAIELANTKMLANLKSNFGLDRLGAMPTHDIECFSSGSLMLDLALGQGFPKGRLIEIFGLESSGKTTLALSSIASIQKSGGLCAFIDVECALDPRYARALGVDTNNLFYCQPSCGEEAFNAMEAIIRSKLFHLVVLDSIAALTPKAEIEGDVQDTQIGMQARLMSKGLRMINKAVSDSGCSVIFINQLRLKIGVMFGDPRVTSGGEAMKYYASVRVDIKKNSQPLRDNNNIVTGIKVKARVIKNKVSVPYGEAEFDIIYAAGIDIAGEVLDLGIKYGIFTKSGAWYIIGIKKLQGRDAAVAYLKTQKNVINFLEQEIIKLSFIVETSSREIAIKNIITATEKMYIEVSDKNPESENIEIENIDTTNSLNEFKDKVSNTKDINTTDDFN